MNVERDREHGSLLVVDDNELNRDMLSRRLARRGHAVQVAESGHQALEMVEKHSFDVVLLDVMMPGIDGFETLSILRNTYAATDLPIVMATAKDQSAHIVNALRLGANDYVTKPLDFPVVLARVQTQISLKRAIDRVKQLEQRLQLRNAELEAANLRMKRDLEAAAKIQQSSLPTVLPEVEGLRFAWAYRPCDELAGDSLNIFQLDDRHIGLYVLDVSGHGVPAALLSVTVNRALTLRPDGSSLITESTDDQPDSTMKAPAALARRLNRIFPMATDTLQYFTVLYGLVEVESRRFRFVGAGHPGPVHATGAADQTVVHESPGYPIGIVEDADYEEAVIEMRAGDRVYLYSDGIIEERNRDGEMFGSGRLIESINQARAASLKESVDALIEQVQAWCGTDKINDDLSIVGMEFV